MSHCCNFRKAPMTRREMLSHCASGFGSVALAALLSEEASGQSGGISHTAAPHFAPKTRNVIFLFMDGGVSQVESFDPKPRLMREDGRPFGMATEPTQFDNIGRTLGSLWGFKQYGESGIPVSDLFPHVGSCVDDMAIVRSMVSNFAEHETASYFLHSGFGMAGRPSMGAWLVYGLGSDNRDLPGYVVINGGHTPAGGIENFGSGFLPATYQASLMRREAPILANIAPVESDSIQQSKLGLMRQLDLLAVDELGQHDALESAIENYELAFRMQSSVPELADISGESKATQELYGIDDEYGPTQTYGRQCLLARRLVERGVRFVELTIPRINNVDRWDAHTNLFNNHTKNSRAIDKPIAGLIKDLKSRGLLDETLIVWAGEFGRTPFAQGRDGRDHNPFGFSIWMAGGGVKGGSIYGATDEYGYKVVENRVEIHDLHATMLHMLGLDHKKVTYRYSGRDMRLTDVHGNIVQDILA